MSIERQHILFLTLICFSIHTKNIVLTTKENELLRFLALESINDTEPYSSALKINPAMCAKTFSSKVSPC